VHETTTLFRLGSQRVQEKNAAVRIKQASAGLSATRKGGKYFRWNSGLTTWRRLMISDHFLASYMTGLQACGAELDRQLMRARKGKQGSGGPLIELGESQACTKYP